MTEAKNRFTLLYGSLVILVLIRIIPFIFPTSRTWGFNHLIFLPSGYSIGFFTIALVALILPFLRNSEKLGLDFVNRFSSIFFESPRRYLYRGLFVLLMAVLFVVFSASTHFLGDGIRIVVNIAFEGNTHYKWSEIGVIFVLKFLKDLINLPDIDAANITVQGVSILSGAISIWFFFLIAQYASDNRLKRLFIFSASLLSGSLLLWFGYVEHYPIIWTAMVVLLYSVVKYISTNRGLSLVWLFAILGIFLHMQMAVFLPGIVYLSILRFLKYRKTDKYGIFMYGVVALILTGLSAIFFYKVFTDLYFQAMFIDFFSQSLANTDYGVVSVAHLLDILNLLILMSPLALVFIVILRKSNLLRADKVIKIFLLLASIGCLAFILLVDPKLGMARDWDLFSFAAYPITLFLIIAIDQNIDEYFKKLKLAAIIILIISPLPYLFVNLMREPSVDYSVDIVSLDPSRSMSQIFILYNYFEDRDEIDKANSLRETYEATFSSQMKCDSATKALMEGDLSRASEILSRVEPSEYNQSYQSAMGRYYTLARNYDKAMEYINNVIQLSRYHSDGYADRARIYLAQGKPDKALDDLRHGYDLDNQSKYILDGLTNTFFALKEYDSTIYYAEQKLNLDSSNPDLYYILVRSSIMLRDFARAEQYFNRFVSFNLPDEKYRKQLAELSQFFKPRQ